MSNFSKKKQDGFFKKNKWSKFFSMWIEMRKKRKLEREREREIESKERESEEKSKKIEKRENKNKKKSLEDILGCQDV